MRLRSVCAKCGDKSAAGAEKGEVWIYVCVCVCCDTADVSASRPLVFVCVRSDANSFFCVLNTNSSVK